MWFTKTELSSSNTLRHAYMLFSFNFFIFLAVYLSCFDFIEVEGNNKEIKKETHNVNKDIYLERCCAVRVRYSLRRR